MLNKLLKHDLKKNMHWMWILFVATIGIALITRGTKELGKNLAFFQMISVFLEGIYYGLAVNVIIQPFLRNFLNFHRSFYSDESYLTHTLPVTKNQLINSKYLTALIEMFIGFATLVVSLLIMYASPTLDDFLSLLISTIITGSFSLTFVIILLITLVIVEFLMFISIIYFSITIAYKSKDKRIFKSFLIATAMSFASLIVLSIALLIVLLINDVKLTISTLILSNTAFISVFATAIILYSAITILFYFLTKRELNKGVNVD